MLKEKTEIMIKLKAQYPHYSDAAIRKRVHKIWFDNQPTVHSFLIPSYYVSNDLYQFHKTQYEYIQGKIQPSKKKKRKKLYV